MALMREDYAAVLTAVMGLIVALSEPLVTLGLILIPIQLQRYMMYVATPPSARRMPFKEYDTTLLKYLRGLLWIYCVCMLFHSFAIVEKLLK